MMYACIFLCLFCLVTKLCPALFATLWTVTHQPPLSMGFFKQEYWNGLPFPSPGLTQGSNSCLLHGRWILYHWAPRVACLYNTHIHFSLSLCTGEGDNRGWDGWMASLTPWTWVWVNSGSWWWTGRPGVLRFMGLQRVGHYWATDLIWYIYEVIFKKILPPAGRRH